MTDSHFAQRCRQRGITSIPGNILAARIMAAIRDKDETFVQFVKRLDDDGNLYRFAVEEGIFYCVAGADYWPRTLFTQTMKRKVLASLKTRRYRASRTNGRTFIRFRDDRRAG